MSAGSSLACRAYFVSSLQIVVIFLLFFCNSHLSLLSFLRTLMLLFYLQGNEDALKSIIDEPTMKNKSMFKEDVDIENISRVTSGLRYRVTSGLDFTLRLCYSTPK